ncbi:putative RNA-directed DNA polymerase [Tanacetum coccineum]
MIYDNKLSICAILESHVQNSNLVKLCSCVFNHWDWTSNGSLCSKGTRIILGWNKHDVDVVVISQSDQVIHTRIWLKLEKKELFCSFVYGHNRYIQRRELWDNLGTHNYYIRSRPWCLLGDFNAALFGNDSTASSSNMDIAMREFKECVDAIDIMDIPCSGLHFTWTQKPRGFDGLLKKIDRVLGNMSFFDCFVGAHAIFQPYRTSDHAPAVLVIPTDIKKPPKPFKFFNILTQHGKFKEVVSEGWLLEVSGFHMFKLTKKLKNLKKPFRKLLHDHGNIHENVTKLRAELDKVQADLDLDPFNVELREEEVGYVQAYNQAIIIQERFLKQKAKILWLKEGDSNSAYFHKAVKGRMSRSRIDVVADSEGILYENDQVADAFVSHYNVFLGQEGMPSCFNYQGLFHKSLESDVAEDMIREVCAKEIKEAMFSMGNDKSPGPDGFTAAFFKESWDIVGNDVIKAIQEFFVNGKLLKELNHTIIALIPKVKSPTKVNDYRPISCCNVLFKCISKIIANRIKRSLKYLISSNQSAFVPGRSISDNILLTHELMHNYHLDRGVPRCAFKVDIQKAYDTVDWEFLKAALEGFGFHNTMIRWIMECVTTTSFSISINGSLYGHFKGKRGLRQGDPISPYLFTIVMEVLTLMLKRRVREVEGFTYHRYCSNMELINLCFADDLFLFAHGDTSSAKIIMDSLDEFKFASGLVPSIPKSKAYFCNVLNHVKLAILQVMPFEEGRLPVKYLGVPLVPSRLVFKDCKELIDKVISRTNDWKNKSLSIAGRLQLIQSVISSMHVFWASVFILPSRVLLDIEQIMRGFLWCQGSIRKGKAKVAWEVVCLPKGEGGLGIRRLDLFNKALMAAHVLNMKESL